MSAVLIAGCGDVGGELARRLLADGHEVYGLRRRPRISCRRVFNRLRAMCVIPKSLRAFAGRARRAVLHGRRRRALGRGVPRGLRRRCT